MKTKINIILLLVFLAGLSFNSCNKDDMETDRKSEREFMTQFRHQQGFRQDDRLSDPREALGAANGYPVGCCNLSLQGKPNSIYLIWYGIEGCLGYHIRIKSDMSGVGFYASDGSIRWSADAAILDTIVYDPATVSIIIDGLNYNTSHHCAIRTLSKKGLAPTKDVFYTPAYENDPYHSLWYGYGGGQHRENYTFVMTAPRPGMPSKLVWYADRDPDGTWVDLEFNLDATAWLLNPGRNSEIQVDANNLFVADYIELKPQVSSSATGPIPETKRLDFGTDIIIGADGKGSVRVTGLTQNVLYEMIIVNDNKEMIKWDRAYNSEMVRMMGPPLPPETLVHKLYTAKPNAEGVVTANERALEALSKKHNACRIDSFLTAYMNDNSYPEDTEFVLESGKTYFINGGISITKGIRLVGADENNKSTFLMGIGYNGTVDGTSGIIADFDKTNVESVRASNFEFGRNAQAGETAAMDISEIVFQNIDFKVEDAWNFDFDSNKGKAYAPNSGIAANYFFNNGGTALSYTVQKLEIINCDFQGFMRGFIRFQGATATKRINQIIMDKVLIYNCGPFDDNGGGYNVFGGAGTGGVEDNVFANVTVKNSSFVDMPIGSIFSEASDMPWRPGDTWNVTLENCTFLNFNTRTADKLIFNLHYPPANSKFTCKKNLFIICPAKNETPDKYFFGGSRVRRYPEGFQWDIANNYSTNVFPGGASSTSIFNSRPFNSATESAGTNGGAYNVGGLGALEILLGSPSLAPEELMIDPYPLGKLRSLTGKGHRHNIDGLYYNNTDKVKNHRIFTEGIGDPRWAKNL